MQRVLDSAQEEGDPPLVEELRPTAESEITVQGDGETFYTAMQLSYEAQYTTDEGSPGEAGPGVPGENVLGLLKTAYLEWKAKRAGADEIVVEDRLEFPQEETEP